MKTYRKMIAVFLVLFGFGMPSPVTVVMATSRCVDVPVKSDFDVQKFMGLWNVLESFTASFLEGVSCPTLTFTLRPDNIDVIDLSVEGVVDVSFLGRSVWRSNVASQGEATILDPSHPAQWSVTFEGQPGFDNGYVIFYIVTTDYTTYAVVYSCIQASSIFGIKIETAYILVRDIQNPPTILGSLKYSLRSWGVNTTNFIPANNKHC